MIQTFENISLEMSLDSGRLKFFEWGFLKNYFIENHQEFKDQSHSMIKRAVKYILNKLPYISRWSQQINELGAFPAGHYYSPIPSRAQVATGTAHEPINDTLAGIKFNQAGQLSLLEELAGYYPDLPFKHSREDTVKGFYLDQAWFGYTDAIMLYGMIRKYRFNRIIEVGSGFSSAAMLESYDSMNESNFNLLCIEPYPDRLLSLIDVKKTPQIELLEKTVQACDLSLFAELEAGDLLFIDSSHVVKYQSDLYHLIFHILPVLKPGVMVHFHDVFYPFEYPNEWLLEGRYWNECYFLRAFLTDNPQWEIVLFNNYVNTFNGNEIKQMMPLCRQNMGGSLYLRKTNKT